MDPETEVGPLVNEESAERVAEWIEEAGRVGGEVLIGGEREGALLRPAVVTEAPAECRLSAEEAFAPVVVVYAYDHLDEAITRANETVFGLQSAVFTRSLDVAMRAAREIESGAVLVNRSSNTRLDHLPYGGLKTSGLGREGAHEAVREMTEIKLVVLGPGEGDEE
jgi:aldehyde dehydrogenase (NAD+)